MTDAFRLTSVLTNAEGERHALAVGHEALVHPMLSRVR